MPDIFVPFDTSYYSDYYRDIFRKGILNRFVLEYVDDNRENVLKNYPEFEIFNNKYDVDEKFLEQFTKYAAKEGVELDKEGFQTSKLQIQIILKALLARDIYSNGDFYKIFNQINNTYLKALEVLNNYDQYLSDYLK
jgi:carboxyl-terminal processing protease